MYIFIRKDVNNFEGRSFPLTLGTRMVQIQGSRARVERLLVVHIFEGKTKLFFVFEERRAGKYLRDSFIGLDVRSFNELATGSFTFKNKELAIGIEEAGIHISTML